VAERLRISADPGNVRLARRFVADVLTAWGLVSAADAVVLLTSELVTNAILYAPGEIEVEVEHGTGWVKVRVTDELGGVPEPRPDSPMATSGRGLAMVETLAAQWGVEDRGTGKAVWFQLEAS
jgi:anti-sigma regulatory factor (Ser/Thr protein kinase)